MILLIVNNSPPGVAARGQHGHWPHPPRHRHPLRTDLRVRRRGGQQDPRQRGGL